MDDLLSHVPLETLEEMALSGYISRHVSRCFFIGYVMKKTNPLKSNPGVYIMENTPPPRGGGKYQPMSFGGKNMKRRREKGGKCKEKGRKGKEKGRKRKENEKRGSKRVK